MNAEEMINAYLEGESASDLVDMIVEDSEPDPDFDGMSEEEIEEFQKHKRVKGKNVSRLTGKRKDIQKSRLAARRMKSAGAKRALQKGHAMWARSNKGDVKKILKYAQSRRGR